MAVDGAVAGAAASIASPDGDDEQVRNVDTGLEVIDQNPACLAQRGDGIDASRIALA